MNLRATLMLSAAILFGAACDDDNSTDAGTITVDVPRPDVTQTDAQTDATQTDVAPTDVAPTDVTQSDTASDATSDASADATSDASADAQTDGGTYVDGCFVGTPVTMSDFLNRCGGAVAFPARAARGSRLTADGGVQPLTM